MHQSADARTEGAMCEEPRRDSSRNDRECAGIQPSPTCTDGEYARDQPNSHGPIGYAEDLRVVKVEAAVGAQEREGGGDKRERENSEGGKNDI